MPSSIDEIKRTLNYSDAYLIGLKGFSINNNLCVSINHLNKLKTYIGNKELFINLNKNFTNSDILKLKDVMVKLNNYNIKGIFYYDVAVINIYNEIDTNYDLVWASEHATTNYATINYWYSFNAKYCLISSDITLKEMLDIRKKTQSKLIVPIFGYQPMFNSKRHIVRNYLEYFKLRDNSRINFMEKEGKVYPILDNEDGTTVYTNYIFNGIKEYNNFKNNNIEYVLLNSFNIDSNKFIEVLKTVKNINSANASECYEHINSLFSNIDTGFLYRETVMRVKKNEK